ncbi:Nonribosomal peptide synthetase dtxS1 [Colletotrichum spinosum]|uniref:Nonribosomal peptide synthetase dtxS1 n=1 Tax=Colletotrichum spinosum TaxID=1347390 RepID=A0A4R8QHE5_9PEZI|nr:Nonribosomal peptide synthetase dtxS1 [Colletotrichum spinosum]
MAQSVSDGDGRDRIWEQNSSVPQGVEGRMDVTISRVVAAQPDAPAVCAWDGDLSYRELDELASRLAVRLQSLGTGPGDIVPLCFEKSQWTVVAVVAVVKTGAAFLLLDPLLPTDRLRAIIQQCRSNLILTSLSHGAMGEQLQLPVTVVTVGPSLGQESLPRPAPSSPDGYPKPKPPTLLPESLLYVVFTSGSTGMPKGCMLSHGNLCSAMHYQNKSLGFRPASRVFDFASYSFDVAVHNLFATLTTGACLCIPSDADRKDNLEGAMARMGATLANLTPTVARLLDPDALPALETLLLLGEQVTDLETTLWCGKAQVVNSYGPAECTPISTANCAASTVAGLRHSGRGIGSVAWIVDPADHDVLLPWGETGELLIEGPIVGQGYLHDLNKTADVFVRDPAWLVRGGPGVPGRTGRLYKTGDLAHYDADGNVVVTGRKDTQVKIRGNRIELGEVEHHVSACMPDVTRVVAEAILPAGAEAGHILVVFLQTDDDDQTDGIRLVDVEDEVASGLARHLPPYMIPTLFFAVPQIPLTLTGKTNRKLLREMGSSFSVDRDRIASHARGPERARRAPRTETERTLQALWARVLGIDGGSIGLDDNFFRLGADSITAMKLVAEARKVNVQISVADIFRHPVLSGLAVVTASAKPRNETDRNGVEHQHHPSTNGALDVVISPGELHHRGPLGPEDIMEILPLSDMQESLAVEGLSDGLQLVDYFHLDLPPSTDLARLEHSCRHLLEAFPVLRAYLLPCAEKHWMVIPRAVDLIFRIIEAESDPDAALARFCLDDIATFGRHQTIVGFFVLRTAESATRLVLRISHAQYDGISIGVLFNALILSYQGTPLAPEPTSFADYTAHVARTRDSAVTYWRGVLQGSSSSSSTTSPAGTSREKDGLRVRAGAPQGVGAQSFRVSREVATPKPLAGITPASYMSAAWAVFLSRLQDGDGEVVFGRLVSGRNAAMPGLEATVGCCVNVVPVRVDTGSASIREVASAVQEQFVSMGDADSLGFKEVVDKGGGGGADFFSCTQHQNVEDEVSLTVERGFTSTLRRFENPRRLPYFLYVISFPRGGKTGLQIFAHTGMLSVERAEELLAKFCLFVEGLS